MAIAQIHELKAALAPGRRLLGLDVGTRTVGLALSDVLLMIATPLETLQRTKFSRDVVRLAELVDTHQVGGFVVGLPISMDGSEGPRCQGVRQFAANLLEVIERPLAFWDERLSTSAVERMLISEADLSRKRRAKIVDKAAAAYILQGALDALRARGTA